MDDSRHALIIANDDYQEGGLQTLTSPAADAEALAEVLGDPRIGGFDVQVVRNQPSYEIRRRIEDFFEERRTTDMLLLHFSCHGLKNEAGELYFAATDTLPKRLRATGVASAFVEECMADTVARTRVLFLDCCFGGAFSPGTRPRAAGDVHVLENFADDKLGGEGRGWAVIAASDSMQYAFEGARLADGGEPKPSVFTSALVKGLSTGEADQDEDGKVSLSELYEYVYNRVVRANRNQTPRCKSDYRGDLYLARTERRSIVPAELPERLRAALASEEMYTRLGAVTELSDWMRHTDLSMAAGARQALEHVARNDIHTVAERAGAALAAVRIAPEPAALRFAPVPRHAVPPKQHVRLLGPPVARSCTPRPSDDRLHAVQSGDGLDVTIDTATPGPLSGDIVLKGCVGEARIHVDAEVREPPKQPTKTPQELEEERRRQEEERRRQEEARRQEERRRAEEQRRRAEAERRAEEERRRAEAERRAEEERRRAEAERRAEEQRSHATTPPPGLKAYRAPALAAAALGTAIASLALGIKATVEAVRLPQAGETWVNIQSHLAQESTRDLVVCLVLALVSLILVGVARYDLRSSTGLYDERRKAAARLLTWSAKVLALPVLVLALLGIIAVMIAANIS
ncbi:caspase family protein [Streptomyces sp. WAC05374]|uniref:caspase family protein n=1 Tax=Streptomyces sp. WAC05374 TaxID=2487420 RepID=UPI000F863C34|nr:caspase family protein [Streptomyces sp. WAC05374]RST13151.1 caspase family protein [Streptomyces sp. WAC05374]TDF48287.1 caspase family protein [Streptomyces sp. WAC05374]TDF49260.1 caspase family protein [Streptomyces sp. WAC05374]TDF55220.1 caspase family protein [Streptomyces sp. WAC05374]